MMERPTWKSTGKALLYMLPMLVIITTFNIYPIFKSFEMSLYADFNFFTQEVYEYGIDPFIDLFNDPMFMQAIRNTLGD